MSSHTWCTSVKFMNIINLISVWIKVNSYDLQNTYAYTHTHTHTHTRARACAHTHTQTHTPHILYTLMILSLNYFLFTTVFLQNFTKHSDLIGCCCSFSLTSTVRRLLGDSGYLSIFSASIQCTTNSETES